MTINERMALKIRLDQLEDAEVRVLQEFRNERECIFKRLRELDEKEEQMLKEAPNQLPPEYIPFNPPLSASLETYDGQVFHRERKVRKSRPSRRSKSSKMREEAIRILKEKPGPIRGAELKRMIEEKTGFKIANMTSFMKTVEKIEPRICKPERGLYQFVEAAVSGDKPAEESVEQQTIQTGEPVDTVEQQSTPEEKIEELAEQHTGQAEEIFLLEHDRV